MFVSDLHLCPTRPPAAALFRRFLAGAARRAEALYILGDLFEYWAGDDDLGDPFNAEMVAALRELSRHVPVGFIVGNRDFLVGAAFAEAAGVSLLPDATTIDTGGRPTLLLHGDTLCTDDHAYQRFRAEVRAPAWRRDFLARPLAARKAEIAALREASEAAKRAKPVAIMDVNAEAVAAAFRAHDYARIIHGHTHRPGHHVVTLDGHRCERWVLADWRDTGHCLVAEGERLRVEILRPD